MNRAVDRIPQTSPERQPSLRGGGRIADAVSRRLRLVPDAMRLIGQILAVLVSVCPAVSHASDARLAFPTQLTMSPKGINLQTGRIVYRHTDLTIGPLSFTRAIGDVGAYGGVPRAFGVLDAGLTATPNSGWSHNYLSGITTQHYSNGTYKRVIVDSQKYSFKLLADGNIVPGDASTQGMYLSQSGGQTIVTDRTGARFVFSSNPNSLLLQLQQKIFPDGSSYSITYTGANQPKAVVSSLGYAILFDYDGNQNIGAICGVNLATGYTSLSGTCSAAPLKVSYGYDGDGSHLTSITDASGGVTSLHYTDVQTGNSYGRNRLSCITLVNSSNCAMQNAFGPQPGDPVLTGTQPDQVRMQTTAAGHIWRYDYVPPENAGDVPQQPCRPSWSSSAVTDAGGRLTSTDYDRGFLANVSGPDGETGYRYPNGCVSGTTGSQPITIETRLPHPTLVRRPGGIREYYEYDLRGNVVRYASFPKSSPDPLLTNGGEWVPSDPDLRRCCLALGTPAIPAGSTVVQADYLPSWGASGVYGQAYVWGCGAGPSDAKVCDKPTRIVDPAGGVTDYTYDPAHGGITRKTGPAVDGIRPETRYTYVQRRAWIANGAGGYGASGDSVWLLFSKSSCRSGPASGSGCALGAADEIRTLYEYGPDAGPNNLTLRGVVEDATGAAQRTCYGYDWMGNRISETRARAGLTVCP